MLNSLQFDEDRIVLAAALATNAAINAEGFTLIETQEIITLEQISPPRIAGGFLQCTMKVRALDSQSVVHTIECDLTFEFCDQEKVWKGKKSELHLFLAQGLSLYGSSSTVMKMSQDLMMQVA